MLYEMKSSASVKRGADRKRNFVGIMLMNRRRGRFQILDEDDGFFRRNQLVAGSAAKLPDHLLIVLHVQRVCGSMLASFW